MAVYTRVTDEELATFLSKYEAGTALTFKGIAEGVENSNYYLETTKSRFILTLFEKRVRAEDLPFFMALMRHLVDAGLPTAAPVADKTGSFLQELNNRPAALIGFLSGVSVEHPTPAHCAALGAMLARLHEATGDFEKARANDLSLAGWKALAAKCINAASKCEDGLDTLIREELAILETTWPAPDSLPAGVVHADLFPDNVLFTGTDITGVIDFYFACTDFHSFDLAICLNAWCFGDKDQFLPENAHAFLTAYQTARPLSMAECAALPALLRGAALRFLLTRLYDWLNQDPSALVTVKDPLEYARKLRFHRENNLLDVMDG